MKVMVVHARYRQRGGEDAAVDAEMALLAGDGHHVIPVLFDNREFAKVSSIGAATGTIWNSGAAQTVRDAIRENRPDVVHVHNTFPAASPAVFKAVGALPLVHTIHNYRWICPAATLLRDGVPCRACVGRLPWRGVWHACYGGGRAASAVVATALSLHRAMGTLNHVDRFIALTDFARKTLVEGGLAAERIVIKPNFTARGQSPNTGGRESYVLFVGRLSEEKGIAVLAEAWRRHADLPPLEVVGDGPMRQLLEGVPNVRLLGVASPDAVRRRMELARLLVVPSIWYEGLPLVVVEAYAAGLPIIGSDLGGLTELIHDGETGWLVPPGEPDALASAIRRGIDPLVWSAMSRAAHARYLAQYTPEANLAMLLEIYAEAAKAAQVRAEVQQAPGS